MLSILVTITLFLAQDIPHSGDYLSLRQAAVTEYNMGKYLKAEELIRKALDSAQSSNNEYDEALSDSALGDILQAERRFAEAEREYRKAVSLLSQKREWTHNAAIAWRNLASCLTAQAGYRQALAALKESSALMARERVQDLNLNAQILNNLGFIYYNQGKTDKAEKFFLKASTLQFTATNPLDVDQWQIVNNLARLYQTTQKYAKAEDFYRRALHLVEVRRGQSDPGLSVVLDNLGMLYVRTGRYQEAESQFQRSLAILERSRMPFDAIFMMRTYYGLGETYLRENNTIRAEEVLARAADIAHKRVVPAEMPEALEVLDAYAKVLNELSQSAEAVRVETEAQRMRANMAYTVPLGNAN